MLKLPSEVHSRICAVSLTTPSRAVEELTYNSIDAKATSIAVRVNVKNGFIQVIDNGYGISKINLKSVGQPYTTTKYDKVKTKSVPEYYGFKGQALASLIKVSYELNITTRSESSSEDTWIKSFQNGKVHHLSKYNVRPSRGTTVEIKGFLYNMQIRNKIIDEFNELNKIKSFMAKLSLVHHNISLSLRDNSKNEIIFKVPKKRDIYHTLNTLYGIIKEDVTELLIEKKDYKIKAFITKKLNNNKWIYLNKKFVANGRIKNTVNAKIKKILHGKKQNKVESKIHNDEEIINKNNELSYFIFIECPYEEYDFSYTPKQTWLEFRNWDHITKMLEKLIQFYFGQLKVKEINDGEPLGVKNKEDIRQEVKNIIHRVLGSLSKKQKMSPIINKIKGKFVKRKKNNKLKELSKTKVSPKDQNHTINQQTKKCEKSLKVTKTPMLKLKQKEGELNVRKKIELPKVQIAKQKLKKKRKNFFTKKFQDENSFVTKRCNELATNVERLLALHRKEEANIKVNRTVQLSNIVKDNRHYTVKQHIEEITVETTKFRNDFDKSRYFEDNDDNTNNNHFHDLIIQQNEERSNPEVNFFTNDKYEFKSSSEFVTYMSHRRPLIETFQSHEVTYHNETFGKNFQPYKTRNFITHESMDNFSIYKSAPKHRTLKFPINKRIKPNTKRFYYNHENTIALSDNITTFKSVKNTENVMNTYELLGLNALNLHDKNTVSHAQFSNKTTNNHLTYNSQYVSDTPDKRLIYKSINNHLKPACPVVDMEISGQYASSGDKTNAKLVNKNTYTLSIPTLSSVRRGQDTLMSPLEQYNIFQKPNDDVQKLSRIFSTTYSVNDNEQTKEKNKSIGCFNVDIDSSTVSHDSLFKSDNSANMPQTNIASKSMNELAGHFDALGVNETCYRGSLNLDTVFDETFNNDVSEEGVIAFQFNNRNKLLPKGMSPICCNKTTFHSLNEIIGGTDFVDQHLYDDFITYVQTNMNVFEPKIQNIKELSCVNVFNSKNKAKKDNEPLIFDGQSLKNAMVLGQVDDKFIAAVIQGTSYKSNHSADFLVLFDQHAVHERIRLENNLLDYFSEDQWNSVEIDSILLKFSNEELIYISNYSDKFKQFGLKWNLTNDTEISVNGIPNAILGKHLRPVDKIIVAVKKMLLELLGSMRSQGGALPLYPKSIMELVFSEACRYAIKFGEKLSKETCVNLLRDLSLCKVPFQCAHGRPVMAVLLQIEPKKHAPYSVSCEIKRGKRNLVGW